MVVQPLLRAAFMATLYSPISQSFLRVEGSHVLGSEGLRRQLQSLTADLCRTERPSLAPRVLVLAAHCAVEKAQPALLLEDAVGSCLSPQEQHMTHSLCLTSRNKNQHRHRRPTENCGTSAEVMLAEQGHAQVVGIRDIDELLALNGPDLAAGEKSSGSEAPQRQRERQQKSLHHLGSSTSLRAR